jgi:hypothetical protein
MTDFAHDFPDEPVAVPASYIGEGYVCRRCGVVRKKYRGVWHYHSTYEHLGTSIRCGEGARVWQSCGRGFNADGSIKEHP